MSVKCPLCDYTSKSEIGVKQHLSLSHDDKNNPYKSKKKCKNCSNSFFILDSYLEMGKGNFCSKECEDNYGNVKCVCNACNEEFLLHKNEYNRRESNGKFCSQSCENNYKSVDRNCGECGKPISVKRALVESGRGKYCSKSCYYKSETKDNAGLRNTSEYKNWRESVIERDGQCKECGSENNLHAHHIVPVKEDSSMVTDLDNGKTLCASCHANKHPEIENLIDNQNL